jgi:TIGR03009 family protein
VALRYAYACAYLNVEGFLMRFASFPLAALLFAATVGLAQPPAGPGAPVAGQPPVPPPLPPKAADQKLDAYLGEWEKKMTDVKNMRTEISLKRTDAVFKKEREYTGVVLCMKPNFAVLRLDYAGDPTKTDYEAYICDGKSVFAYSGKDKTITQIKLPQNQTGVDNLMLDFLAGMKSKDVKERFDISLFKTDEHYIYLDIKPLRAADQREFTHLRLALYGPGAKTASVAYMPAQVYMLKPSGDAEMWKFTNTQTDLPGVAPANFQFVPIKGWQVQEAPQQPVGGVAPKGPLVPAGGAVRPGQTPPRP